jgi:hypothetical protein
MKPEHLMNGAQTKAHTDNIIEWMQQFAGKTIVTLHFHSAYRDECPTPDEPSADYVDALRRRVTTASCLFHALCKAGYEFGVLDTGFRFIIDGSREEVWGLLMRAVVADKWESPTELLSEIVILEEIPKELHPDVLGAPVVR